MQYANSANYPSTHLSLQHADPFKKRKYDVTTPKVQQLFRRRENRRQQLQIRFCLSHLFVDIVSSNTSYLATLHRQQSTEGVVHHCHAMVNEHELVYPILPFPTNLQIYSKNLSIAVSTKTVPVNICATRKNWEKSLVRTVRPLLIRSYWNTSPYNVCHQLNQIPLFATPSSNFCPFLCSRWGHKNWLRLLPNGWCCFGHRFSQLCYYPSWN